ncbi:hypothetical protein QUB33_23980 [Microcoleus sp. B3-A4]
MFLNPFKFCLPWKRREGWHQTGITSSPDFKEAIALAISNSTRSIAMNEFHHSINRHGETGFVNSGSFSLNGQNSVITDKQFVTLEIKKGGTQI